jgi:hypothetical protein
MASNKQQTRVGNTLTLADMVMNGAQVMETETPLALGITKIADEDGHAMVGSLTIERDWLWLRFPKKPIAAHRDALGKKGWVFGGKRGGWHAPVSTILVDTLNKWTSFELNPAHVTALSVALVDAHDKRIKDAVDAKRKADIDALKARPASNVMAQALANAQAVKRDELPEVKPTTTSAKGNGGARKRNPATGRYEPLVGQPTPVSYDDLFAPTPAPQAAPAPQHPKTDTLIVEFFKAQTELNNAQAAFNEAMQNLLTGLIAK